MEEENSLCSLHELLSQCAQLTLNDYYLYGMNLCTVKHYSSAEHGQGMDIDHCIVIIVGVIIFFYTNHVSKLHVEL